MAMSAFSAAVPLLIQYNNELQINTDPRMFSVCVLIWANSDTISQILSE